MAIAHQVNPELTFFLTSACTGEGMASWYGFLGSGRPPGGGRWGPDQARPSRSAALPPRLFPRPAAPAAARGPLRLPGPRRPPPRSGSGARAWCRGWGSAPSCTASRCGTGWRGGSGTRRGRSRWPSRGRPARRGRFLVGLRAEAPPLARVDALEVRAATASGAVGFEVLASDVTPQGRLPVAPDVATCPACGPSCGTPRTGATAIRSSRAPTAARAYGRRVMPYDRERTSMRAFPQCPACAREYGDPASRRYHSETNAVRRAAPASGSGPGWTARSGRGGGRCARGRRAALRSGRRRGGEAGWAASTWRWTPATIWRCAGCAARKGREAKPLAVMVASWRGPARWRRWGPRRRGCWLRRSAPSCSCGAAGLPGWRRSVAPGLDAWG